MLFIAAEGPQVGGRSRRELGPELIAAIQHVVRERPSNHKHVPGVQYTYVSETDLPADGANLTPSRWLQIQLEGQQPEKELAAAVHHQVSAAAELAKHPFLSPTLGPEREQLATIGELVGEGALTVFRAAQRPKSDRREEATHLLVAVSDIRPDGRISRPRVGLDNVPLDALSQPGDLFVVLEGNVRAAVDLQGGYTTQSPVVRLRVQSPAIDPFVLASAISAPINARATHGSTIPRLDLLQVRVPRMRIEESCVAGHLLRIANARRQARVDLDESDVRIHLALIQSLFTRTWT